MGLFGELVRDDEPTERNEIERGNRMTTIHELLTLVETCVGDAFISGDLEGKYPDDMLTEIADGCIPVYYYDLAQVLASDASLGFAGDFGPVDGELSVYRFIQMSIYERLKERAREIYERLIESECEEE